jgi:GNAT superfamily N-acetyltransferase
MRTWRPVGAYASDRAMVGFDRGFSDVVSGAYVADGLVLPARRGRGVGRRLVESYLERPASPERARPIGGPE